MIQKQRLKKLSYNYEYFSMPKIQIKPGLADKASTSDKKVSGVLAHCSYCN